MEMLFGQLTLMVDGCGKLDSRHLQDVLKRVMITNSFLLLPAKIRGFPFLTYLKHHMKSYKPYLDDSGSVTLKYPEIKKSDGNVVPKDSPFDESSVGVKKRKVSKLVLSEPLPTQLGAESDNVRKFHKKF